MGANHLVALPVTHCFTAFHVCGADVDGTTDRNAITRLATPIPAPFSPLPWQQFPELFGFLRRAVDPVVNALETDRRQTVIARRKSAGDLFWCPALVQPLNDEASKLQVSVKKAETLVSGKITAFRQNRPVGAIDITFALTSSR